MMKKFVIITLSIIFSVCFAFIPSIEFLLNFANDDSFFYIKTAYNLSAGFGSTFDTINNTNGYHPLWFLILSLYYFIINFFSGFTSELYFRFTVLLITLINFLTCYFVFNFLKSSYPRNYERMFYLVLPLFITFVAIRDFGMETHLLCLFISAYLYVKSDETVNDKDYTAVKVFLISALFLTRIDFLLTALPVIIAADYLTAGSKFRNKFLKVSSITLILIAAMYFSFNYFFFGSVSTISASIKNSLPEIIVISNIKDLFAPGTFTNQFLKTLFTVSTVLFFLMLVMSGKFRKKFTSSDYFLWGICLSSAVFLFLNLAVNFHALKEWYVAFPSFVCALLIVRLISFMPRMFYFSLILFTAIFVFYFYRTRIENYKWNSMYYFALDLKKATSEEDRIFMIDLSGITGYFSERNVINGDGLINNFEYWEYKSAGKLEDYLKVKNIGYYATYSTEKGNHAVTEVSGFFNDFCYQNINFGGYHFRFPVESLVLKTDYYYSHAVNSDKGYWYLFKLK